MDRKSLEELAAIIIDAAIEVHRVLGPGLLECIYEEAFEFELSLRGIRVLRQQPVPVYYKGRRLARHLVMDMIVEDAIIVELKAVTEVLPIHQAQLLTYLKVGDKPLGFLFNFHEVLLKNGIKRMINNIDRLPPGV